jgi:phosphoacetylglucosamine mutase
LSGKIIDIGVVTTPQLHFAVRQLNRDLPWDEQAYYNHFASAFKTALSGVVAKPVEPLIIDGSNGVGGPKARLLFDRLQGVYQVEIRNVNGKLNFQVGADFVKTQQRIPTGISLEDKHKKIASVDGDADRVIYYYLDENGIFHMLDGDKIACLIASYIKEELDFVGANFLKMGVVQTAYANGASTQYIVNKLNVPVACTPTGVKYLHHQALEFDIGVYFEANGHGTVTFKESAIQQLHTFLQQQEQNSSNQLTSDKKNSLYIIKFTQFN